MCVHDIVTHTPQGNQLSGAAVTPFRRVGEEVPVDPRLQDNSFEAKSGSRGSWGEKANRDLKFTKGSIKSFPMSAIRMLLRPLYSYRTSSK